VEPSVTQILRKSSEPGTVAKIVEDLKLKEMDYVFFPVNNNNKVDGEGGSHWSLLVYISDKGHGKFFHHDPISNTNYRHAKELVENLSRANTFFKFNPKIEEVVVPKQLNGYDCGIYTVIYAGVLANDITNGFAPKLINITPEEVNKCRKTLRQKISAEKEKEALEKKKKSNETDQNIKKKANETRTINVCGRHVNHTCWRGEDCTLEHPKICEADVYEIPCKEKPCKLYHPKICFTNLHHKVCKWGAECKFRHLIKGYDPKYNTQRHNSHHDHHDKRLTNSYNNNRYGDGPYHNKREAHDPNRYKYRDLGNNHTYNTYKHQNPQMGPLKNKYNQNTQRNQGPRNNYPNNYPNDNYNQNKHFLGQQQNTTDWPTPREAELFGILRNFFLQEGPARR